MDRSELMELASAVVRDHLDTSIDSMTISELLDEWDVDAGGETIWEIQRIASDILSELQESLL